MLDLHLFLLITDSKKFFSGLCDILLYFLFWENASNIFHQSFVTSSTPILVTESLVDGMILNTVVTIFREAVRTYFKLFFLTISNTRLWKNWMLSLNLSSLYPTNVIWNFYEEGSKYFWIISKRSFRVYLPPTLFSQPLSAELWNPK